MAGGLLIVRRNCGCGNRLAAGGAQSVDELPTSDIVKMKVETEDIRNWVL